MIRFFAVLFGAVMTFGAAAQAAPPPVVIVPPHGAAPHPSPQPSTNRPGSPAPPGVPAPGAGAGFDLGVWTVRASSLDANFKNGDFSTPAKVVMTRVGGDVSADRANGNYKKQLLYLNGHVVMHDSQGSAAGLEGGTPGPSAPSTLTADKAQIDGAAKVYKAMGNVRYTQAETVVTADNGTLDDSAHTLLLEGTVHITSGTRSMNAQKVLYNTITGNAHAEGNVTMQFPGEFHRHLATPKPLKVPKNGLTQPITPSSAPP